jgi:hypothetical protein
MNPANRWVQWAGYGINALIAALMLFAGAGKAFGFAPPEIMTKLKGFGLAERAQLIGAGEMAAAVLLLISWTSPLGVLLTSGFWGGVICIHMAHGEDIVFPSVLLALTWVGAFLRGSVPLVVVPPVAPRTGPAA